MHQISCKQNEFCFHNFFRQTKSGILSSKYWHTEFYIFFLAFSLCITAKFPWWNIDSRHCRTTFGHFLCCKCLVVLARVFWHLLFHYHKKCFCFLEMCVCCFLFYFFSLLHVWIFSRIGGIFSGFFHVSSVVEYRQEISDTEYYAKEGSSVHEHTRKDCLQCALGFQGSNDGQLVWMTWYSMVKKICMKR